MRSRLVRNLAIGATALLVLLGVVAGTAWWLATRQATVEWVIAEAVRLVLADDLPDAEALVATIDPAERWDERQRTRRHLSRPRLRAASPPKW